VTAVTVTTLVTVTALVALVSGTIAGTGVSR
jgi:hypothetical protein